VEPSDRTTTIFNSVKLLLETFVIENPPLKLRDGTLALLEDDPESLFVDLNATMLSWHFNRPKNFPHSRYQSLLEKILAVRADLESRSPKFTVREKVVESFGSKYEDPVGAVKSFADYLMNCSDSFCTKPSHFMSPYISIVQSSMYGKTRLAREIAEYHYRTVYVCLRSKTSSGYPYRTEGAFNFLFAGPILPSESEEEQPRYFSDILAGRLKRLIWAALTNLQDPRQLVDSAAVNSDRSCIEFPSEQIAVKLWNKNIFLPWTAKDDDGMRTWVCSGTSPDMVVLAIDEARYTLEEDVFVSGISLFRHIRRAARLCALTLPAQIRFMVVFLDTSSKIQNFSPSSIRDPSHRETELQDESMGRVLFRPYIVSHTFDIYFKRVLQPGSTDLTPLIGSSMWLRAGRPTMEAHTRTGDDTLEYKLQGGSAPIRMVDKLAILLARIGAQLHPRHHYASEMVAGNMATLLGVDLARESCVTVYASEPALACAAGRIWGKDRMLEDELIPALHDAVISGAFNKGRDGEIIAQIILLLAFDKVCKMCGKDIGEVVPLRQVIAELLPEELREKEVEEVLRNCIPEGLQQSQISCCHFVNLCGKLKQDDILHLAERHSGAVLSVGQSGLDLLLPILHESLAAVVVQVKACVARKDNNYPRSAGLKLRPSVAFKDGPLAKKVKLTELDTNTVRIYMQLGVVGSKVSYVCKKVDCDDENGAVPLSTFPLQLFGIKSRCLSSTVRSCLTELLQDHVHWEAFFRRESLLEKRAGVDCGPSWQNIEDMRRSWPFVINTPDSPT